jgi:hypothetical protein
VAGQGLERCFVTLGKCQQPVGLISGVLNTTPSLPAAPNRRRYRMSFDAWQFLLANTPRYPPVYSMVAVPAEGAPFH